MSAKSRSLQKTLTSFAQLKRALIKKVKDFRPFRVAVINAHELNSLRAIHEVYDEGFIEPVLIGDPDHIYQMSKDNNLKTSKFQIIPARSTEDATITGARLAVAGEVDILFRGRITVYEFLHVLCNREYGFRQKHELFSHVAVFEMTNYPRLLLLSDSGVVIAPTLDLKVRIINQAVDVALALGIQKPKVALLAAVETVKSYLPVSLEGAALAKMGDRGQIGRAIIDGPLALDVAVSEESARIKGLHSPVAGKADILIAPQIEAGNSIYLALVAFGRARAAGVVVGARCPVIVASRTDSHVNRVNSIHLASWLVDITHSH